MLSGPEALCGLMLLISFSTPETAIMMSFMLGKGFPSSPGIEVRSSFINTDLNCAFKISALVALPEYRTPWRFSGATPGCHFYMIWRTSRMVLCCFLQTQLRWYCWCSPNWLGVTAGCSRACKLCIFPSCYLCGPFWPSCTSVVFFCRVLGSTGSSKVHVVW